MLVIVRALRYNGDRPFGKLPSSVYRISAFDEAHDSWIVAGVRTLPPAGEKRTVEANPGPSVAFGLPGVGVEKRPMVDHSPGTRPYETSAG